MPTKTEVGGFGGDWEKWLPLIAALVALGVLPRRWGKLAAMAAVSLWLRRFLGE
jgi:hypothetical protein